MAIWRTVTHNGTAVEGVNVTRRMHRAVSRYFSREMVTVQEGYGTRFCRHGRNFIELDECRGTRLVSGREVFPVQEFTRLALVQCRGTRCHGASNLSGCRFIIAGRCAYPGLSPKRIFLGSRSKSKNRDKFITPTDRVTGRFKSSLRSQLSSWKES